MQRPPPDPANLKAVHDGQKLSDRPRQPIQPKHDEHIAVLHERPRLGKLRAIGRVPLIDSVNTRSQPADFKLSICPSVD
jgi:hypothetical protein